MVRAAYVPSVAFILLFFFTPVNLCLASEKFTRSSEGILLAQSDGTVGASNTLALGPSTKDELLLFWEEKDLYVQSATRNAKSISQVAENISVVTAKEIEDMNTHTIYDVLNRVTGVFISPQGGDFASAAMVYIQSPTHRTNMDRHVLVLIDGVIWNTGESNAQFNEIPVGIIERIEIIKGPASSAWGSSLGGVINIITKDTGSTKKPSGTISASYGQGNSQDYNADISGKAGELGYYLFTQRQRSDGIGGINRYYDKNSFYSKFSLPLSKDISLGFTAGYNESDSSGGDYLGADFRETQLLRDFFATASLNASLTNELSLKLSFYTFNNKFISDARLLGLGFYNNPPGYVEAPGDLFAERIFRDKTTGESGRLIWTHGMHTVVLGTDLSQKTFDATLNYGNIGVPAVLPAHPVIDKWSVYANDTITVGRLSITPGIRYDHNTITGGFASPSLGATYKLAEKTILRMSVARGFTIPMLVVTSGTGVYLNPSPNLKPETVWSYQAGIESSVTDYVWLKATVFDHELKDALQKVFYAAGPPTYNDMYFNIGGTSRHGIEVEAETAPVYDLSLKAGITCVRMISGPVPDAAPAPFPAPPVPAYKTAMDAYSYNLGVKYEDRKSFMAQLSGYYTWWDMLEGESPKYENIIWDLNLRKKVYSKETFDTELYLTVHNIFNGSYYVSADQKNAQRWAEAGVRFKF